MRRSAVRRTSSGRIASAGRCIIAPRQSSSAHLGTSLSNLAHLYQAQGRYEEADPLYKRSLAIVETVGREHPNVAVQLSDLATFYQAQGRHEEAERLYLRSLAILIRRKFATTRTSLRRSATLRFWN